MLEDADLMAREPDGRMTRCVLEPETMLVPAGWVERFRTCWEGQRDAQARYVEEFGNEDESPGRSPDEEEERR